MAAAALESLLPGARWWPRGAPRVSVVVPTCRRPRQLGDCLEALLVQDLGPATYEIVVVDDGHEPRIEAAVARLARTPGAPRLRYLRPSEGRGPAVARNCGWRAARGEIVAFTDDDTIPDRGWLTAGEHALRAHPEWSAAAGTVEGPRPSDDEPKTPRLAHADFVTANAFVRRNALEQVGGFDERLRRVWREDSNLPLRLAEQAGPVGRAPAARVQRPASPAPRRDSVVVGLSLAAFLSIYRRLRGALHLRVLFP